MDELTEDRKHRLRLEVYWYVGAFDGAPEAFDGWLVSLPEHERAYAVGIVQELTERAAKESGVNREIAEALGRDVADGVRIGLFGNTPIALDERLC